MGGIEAIVALLCSGLCCLSVAAVMLVVVLFALRRASSGSTEGEADWAAVADAGASGPMLGEQLDPQPAMVEESEPEPEMVPAAERPTAISGTGTPESASPMPLGGAGPIEPRRQPRSSGQTIIAFDDDDDDW